MRKRVVILTLAVLAVSCSPYKAVYQSRTYMELILVNDSILRFLHHSGSGSYPYRRDGDVIRVTPTEKGLRTGIWPDMPHGEVFELWHDSIVMPRKGLILYKAAYFKEHHLGETFYFIKDGKKYKVSPEHPNSKRYFDQLDEEFFIDLIGPDEALSHYGVNPNFNCYIITEFPSTHHDPHDLD